MISQKQYKIIQKALRWPCSVCGKGVGNNSIVYYLSEVCRPHCKCIGIKGSMQKVIKTIVNTNCLNPVSGTRCTSSDISVNANLYLVSLVI